MVWNESRPFSIPECPFDPALAPEMGLRYRHCPRRSRVTEAGQPPCHLRAKAGECPLKGFNTLPRVGRGACARCRTAGLFAFRQQPHKNLRQSLHREVMAFSSGCCAAWRLAAARPHLVGVLPKLNRHAQTAPVDWKTCVNVDDTGL